MRGIVSLAALAAATLACATASTPTPVTGTAADVGALAGEWHGEYSGPSGRSGGISFTLRATDTSAIGQVVMSPDPVGGINSPATSSTSAERAARMVTAPRLSVTFIRVAGDSVRGTLEPYEDPECRCQVATSFEGVHRGRVIEGDYRTYGANLGTTRVGRWRVERRAGSP